MLPLAFAAAVTTALLVFLWFDHMNGVRRRERREREARERHASEWERQFGSR